MKTKSIFIPKGIEVHGIFPKNLERSVTQHEKKKFCEGNQKEEKKKVIQVRKK